MKAIHVAVGVIKQNGKFFICKRAAHQHQGGLWEFPGGKVEKGESALDALKRELYEEIGIIVKVAVPLIQIEHHYPDKKVILDVHLVEDFIDEPSGKEGQESRWISANQFCEYDFPEANKAIINKLV